MVTMVTAAGGSSSSFFCSAAVAAATTALPTVAATPLITAAAAIAAKYKKGAPIGAPTDLSKGDVTLVKFFRSRQKMLKRYMTTIFAIFV